MAQQQQQQAPGTPAAADVCEFAAGVALRMWEQNSGGMVRRRTGNMYDFMCMGCLGSGGEADAYLVELTGITPPADPSPAQAAASAAAVRQHMPATARMLLGNMMMMRPAAALMRATYPAPSLQVGSLYVLKVCRPQQSSTGEQPTPAAACKFLRAAASHMHNEHMCYVALQGCEHVVHCFGYGSAAAVPPATTTSSPAAAAAAAAAAATPLSSSASSSSSAAAAAMGVATAVAAPSASSTPVTTAPSSATAAAAASVERPCLLLEYAPGGSIALLLKTAAGEPAGMTEEQAKCVIKHVATVLKDCHRERILFRDLHPGNIVFNEAAPGQRCYKLIDFGSAHMLAKGLGRGAMFGVPYYRVPEQLEWCYHHDTLDTAKLGLLLLELRTGELEDGMR
jgi:hypothetical protein